MDLANSAEPASCLELCLGAMTFGNEADEATSQQIVDRFVDAGGDSSIPPTCPARACPKRSPGTDQGKRDQIVLATKARPTIGNDTKAVAVIGISAARTKRRCAGSRRSRSTSTRCTSGTGARRSRRRCRPSTTSCTRQGPLHRREQLRPWHLAKALGISALHNCEPFVYLQAESR